MGADEAATLARIASLRAEVLEPLLAEHRGRLFKTMGDGFLVEFASAVQAVACAVAVQARLAEQPDGLRLRIGIHAGDVVVQGEDLMGDGINIAARLEPLAEAGGVVISARVREDLAGKLTVGTEDMGEQILKNITVPIRAFRIRPATAPVSGLALPEKPSIAVLAFTNMSGDPEQEYFADGIAEDIITELSHIRWLFVIARNSSFTYKGRAVDVKQVSRELGVRYVLEGSVRRAGNRLRITVQLIEAETGTHAWAERYDRTLADIFVVQDEITEAVVSAIEPAMANVERQRVGGKAPENLATWELYHRGLWHFFKMTPEDNRLGIECLHKAVTLDPNSAVIHAALGMNYLVGGRMFVPQELALWRASGFDHGRIAVGLDPSNAMAHAVYGFGLQVSDQHEMAVNETTYAIALNPSNAFVQAVHGAVLAFSGRSGDALEHFAIAIRLSPLDPLRWHTIFLSTNALYFHGDYEACATAGRDVCRLQPDLVFGYRACVIALAELGRIDQAHQYADVIHTRFNDEMRISLSARTPGWRALDYARFTASLAKGGLVLRDGVLTRVG
jgi:adenylate cyclase